MNRIRGMKSATLTDASCTEDMHSRKLHKPRTAVFAVRGLLILRGKEFVRMFLRV